MSKRLESVISEVSSRNQDDLVSNNIEIKPTDWFQVIEQAMYNLDIPESTKYEILL